MVCQPQKVYIYIHTVSQSETDRDKKNGKMLNFLGDFQRDNFISIPQSSVALNFVVVPVEVEGLPLTQVKVSLTTTAHTF